MPCYRNANYYCNAVYQQLIYRGDQGRLRKIIWDDQINRMAGLNHYGCKAVLAAEEAHEKYLPNESLIFKEGGHIWTPLKKSDGFYYQTNEYGTLLGAPILLKHIIAIPGRHSLEIPSIFAQ